MKYSLLLWATFYYYLYEGKVCMINIMHISDSHFTSKHKYDRRIPLLVKSLRELPKVKKMVIVYSGDISMSGRVEEFEKAKNFLRDLVIEIKKDNSNNLDIEVLVTPGNHDIDFQRTPVNREDILKEQGNDNDTLESEYLDKMRNFFDFAKEYNCFSQNKFLDIKSIFISNKEIKFYLVNTALYSLYKDKNNDSDYDLHHIPTDVIEQISNESNGDFNVGIFHHHIRFFNQKIYNLLVDAITNKIDLLFIGHEHINGSEKVVRDNKREVSHKKVGALFSENKSEFQVLNIKLESKQNSLYRCIWKDDIGRYACNNVSSELKFNQSVDSLISLDYVETIRKCDEFFINGTLDNIFVFPYLQVADISGIENESKKIDSFQLFKKSIKDKTVCYIEGDDSSGRTTLGKYLFYAYSRDKLPLLVSSSDMNNKSWDKSKKDIIEVQYGMKNYNAYLQSDEKKKILILDDIHLIDSSFVNTIIERETHNFYKIILLSSSKVEYDYLRMLDERDVTNGNVVHLSIMPLLFRKRNQLIEKALLLKEPNLNKGQIKNRVTAINKQISEMLNILKLNPSYLLMFLNAYLNGNVMFGNSGIFNSLFESQILSKINQSNKSDSKEYIDPGAIQILLKRIAIKAHIEKEYPIGQNKVISIINEYNNKASKYRKSVNPQIFFDKMTRIKILKYVNDSGDLSFASNNYLSYFIAKVILSEYLKGDDTNIAYIVKNICFGINSDIALFLCYLAENTKILNDVLKRSEDFFGGLKEVDFNDNEDVFIFKSAIPLPVSIPTEEDKSKALDVLEKQENEITRAISVKNIYEYDEEDAEKIINKYIAGMKYIEILSKSLPDFIHAMDSDAEIEKFIEAVYLYPNKELSFLIDVSEDVYNSSNDELMKEFNLENEQEIVKLRNRVLFFAQSSILNVYDLTARLAGSEDTYEGLCEFDTKNRITYQLLKIMILENTGKTVEMGKMMLDLSEKHKNNYALNAILKRILRKHMIHNEIRYIGDTQTYIDRIMGLDTTKHQGKRRNKSKNKRLEFNIKSLRSKRKK